VVDNATNKSDIHGVEFERALDGVGRAEVESRYRRAVFEAGELGKTLTVAQEVGTRLYNENVLLKNGLRAAKILLEAGNVTRALDVIVFALSAQPHSEKV
jgi:hypothetical protein